MHAACNIARNDAYDQNIVIDMEFTPVPNEAGPSCLRYETIQIGAVRVSPDGRMLDQFCCFVRPQLAPFVSWKVQHITGIRDSALRDAPSFAQAPELLDAEHTARLLISLLKGEHLEHAKAMRQAMGKGKERSGYNVMAGALAGLLSQMQGA